jgi:hypothetical protein
LVSGNWEGRYRPYRFDGQTLVALLPQGAPAAVDLDLFTPLALSSHELLLAGTEAGKPEYDIYLHDLSTGVLKNLTDSPGRDEGRLCVQPEGRLVAFRAGRTQRFARVADGLEPLAHQPVPGFQECRFVSATELLGVERTRAGYTLHRCTLSGASVTCLPSPALSTIEHFVAFTRPSPSAAGLIARQRGDAFRRAWLLAPGAAALTPAPVKPVEADVLDYDGEAVRYGSESRYWSSLAPNFEGIVYRTRRIGGTYFAIVATPRAPRSLARLGPEGWELIRPAASAQPAATAPPREIWLHSETGQRYQAFEFGPASSKKQVVWWHGGPHENVSPRFNPYFAALNRLGFSVLAVNYPGSTGRGAAYEQRFDAASVGDCLSAVWRHLERPSVQTVVSWSVSSGSAVQELLLARGYPLSAVIDQSGWGRSRILELAAEAGVPVLTIRGRHDRNAPVARIDHAYAGGHDITLREHFEAAMTAVEVFLAGLAARDGVQGGPTGPRDSVSPGPGALN